MPLYIAAGALLAGALLAAALVIWIGRKIRRFSRAAFGTDRLADGIRMQQDRLAVTPKSLSAMTRLCLPRIEADFPGFSFEHFRQRAENALRDFLLALDTGRADGLGDEAHMLREQLLDRLEISRRQGRREHFADIVIHRTEIARYDKQAGRCVVRFQSAVGYRYFCTEDGRLTAGSRERDTQTRYNIDFYYIQDAARLPGGQALGLNCPRCGAPVTGLGAKTCAYCGAGVREIEDRVWRIGRIEEAVS